MIALRRIRLFAALAALAGAIGLGQAQAAPEPPQVLVMLRLPPQHARPNADYGGAYGDSEGRGARLRAAARLAQRYGLALVSEWPMPLIGVDCFVMAAPADQSAEAVAARLTKDPGVSWSEPLHLYRAQGAAPATHDDPLFRVQPAAAEWKLAALHQISTGRNVRVAVIDSTIERTHPDLAGQVEVSQNFVAGRPAPAERHGTGVAGIIAAKADNGAGIVGVAPGARILGLRACWQGAEADAATVCDSLSLAKALDYAISHDAQVINLSLSGPPDLLLGRLIDAALGRGVTVVTAYDRAERGGGFPASHRGVVAVIDEAAGLPPEGVVGAPGRDVPTTLPGGRWSMVDGASYAAAHVSGLYALIRARNPAARGRSILVIAHPGDTIDACATLIKMSGPCACGCSAPRELLASLPK